jgi:hypothetical protein
VLDKVTGIPAERIKAPRNAGRKKPRLERGFSFLAFLTRAKKECKMLNLW